MRNWIANGFALTALLVLVSCSHGTPGDRSISSSKKRGDSFDYDAGPAKDSDLTYLFANTPNYRAFGSKVIGGKGEKFRWKFGPMWYRGRTGENQVKVFVIGQEGAQDENVSNRSFTGSTGTKMQKFLNHIGINQSYLFMNTFVYTITGQYSLFGEDAKNPTKVAQRDNLLWLAQNSDSVVVKHRHELFDTVLETNKELSIVLGVGTAGKDTAATYARHLGGKCSSSTVGRGGCFVKHKGKTIMFVGVPHPGGASPRNGGEDALKRLLGAFDRQAKTVLKAISAKKIKLANDPGAKRASTTTKYKYGNASIPHMDFAFGTNWRMGEWGTTSNRRGSHTIQVFSKNGCYNNGAKEANGRCSQTKVDNIRYSDPVDKMTKAPSEMAKCDVPYESPKTCTDNYMLYDHGPGHEFSEIMLDWYKSIDWGSLGVTQHMSFGPQGFYRGSLKDAEVLVIADQHAHDDMFSGRALTGEVGQRFQSYLDKSKKEYAIIRTLPVDTLDLSSKERAAISMDKDVIKGRDALVDAIVDAGQITQIIGIGTTASKIAKQLAKDYDVSYKGFTTAAVKKMPLKIIPRFDLPVHTRYWMGTSGDRAARGYRGSSSNKEYSGDYYKVYAPRWATKWKAGSMSTEESKSYETFKN